MTPQPGTPEFKPFLVNLKKHIVHHSQNPLSEEVLETLINGCRLAERYRKALAEVIWFEDHPNEFPTASCRDRWRQALTTQSIEGGK